jgi:hypothetical protein
LIYYKLTNATSALIAALYRPYIKHSNLPGDPLIEKFRMTALRKMEEASAGVASTIHKIITQLSVENIPIIL